MTENDNGCRSNESYSGNRSCRPPQSTGPAFAAVLEGNLLPGAPRIVDSLAALMGLTPPQVPEIVFDDFSMPAWNIDLLVREGLIEPLRSPRTEGSEDGPRADGSHLYLSEDGTDVLDLLGCYDAHPYRVTLFVRLIDLCATQLALDAHALAEVVLVHELAHAVTHRGRDLDREIWASFSVAPSADLELFAQLYTARHLEAHGPLEALAAMKILAERQPRIYQTYRNLVDEPLERLRSRLLETRRRTSGEITGALALQRVAKRSRYWRGEVTRMFSHGVIDVRLELDPMFFGPRGPDFPSRGSGQGSKESWTIVRVATTEIVVRDSSGRAFVVPWEAIVGCHVA